MELRVGFTGSGYGPYKVRNYSIAPDSYFIHFYSNDVNTSLHNPYLESRYVYIHVYFHSIYIYMSTYIYTYVLMLILYSPR
jgi:hypothetical protein